MKEETVDNLLQKGYLLVSLKRYKEATEIFEKIITLQPDNASSIFGLAITYIRIGNLKDAKHLIGFLFQYAPNESETYFVNAYYHLSIKKLKKAKEDILQAISLNPEDATYFSVLALIYETKGEWELAYQTAKSGLQLNPDESGCLRVKILSCYNLGFYGEMMELISMILKISPDNSETHTIVGWARLYNEDFTEAESHFYEALRIDPMDDSAKKGVIQLIKKDKIIHKVWLNFQKSVKNISAENLVIWAFSFSVTYLAIVWQFIPFWKVILHMLFISFGSILFFIFLKVFEVYFNLFVYEPLTNIILLSSKHRDELLTEPDRKKGYITTSVFICIIFIISYFIYAKL